MSKTKIIFFGNGPLADAALRVFERSPDHKIIFHAHSKEDLKKAKDLKLKNPDALGVLASFGVILKPDFLKLFEPVGILNIHPSLLPKHRGPSPVETAILEGDEKIGVSVIKLTEKMDAGPIFFQYTYDRDSYFDPCHAEASDKSDIYDNLAYIGAAFIAINSYIFTDPEPHPIKDDVTIQDENAATYCKKLDKSMSPLDPDKHTARELIRQISAFSGFPKSTYTFSGHECIIHEAHTTGPTLDNDVSFNTYGHDLSPTPLHIECYDGSILYIDKLQPAGRKIMDAQAFVNGYMK